MSAIISFDDSGFDACNFDGSGTEAAVSVGAAGSLPAVLVWKNSPHCSAVSSLLTLTPKKADARSLLGYTDSGTATAASATPPGCTKSMGTGSWETSSLAAVPVSRAYLRGY